MRQSRIYTSQPLQLADPVELSGPTAHYLARVLRLSKGDPLILFNGDGRDYAGEITAIQPQRVQARLLDSREPGNESPLKITLVQAVCRGERMDYALQKATELGVFCIQPLISQRVEVRLDTSRQAKRMEHWRGVVIAACEQSGRALVPEVRTPLSMPAWLASAGQSARLVLDPCAADRLAGLTFGLDAVSIAIGPEGGFTEQEMEAVRTNGLMTVSLGPRVLRTETAGAAAIAVLQAKTGGL